MNKSDEIASLEKEMKELKKELELVAAELKANPSSATRKELLEERTQIEQDIKWAEQSIALLKQIPDEHFHDNTDDGDVIAEKEEHPDELYAPEKNDNDLH